MGLDDADQEAALVRGRPPVPADVVRGRPACQARAFAGRGHPWGDRVCLACGCRDRPRFGPGPRTPDQARGQAGGPAAVQPRHRRRCLAGPLGTVCGGKPVQHHGGDGLDRLRRLWPDDDHAVAAVPPRARDAAGVADGRHGHAEGPAQRLRGSGADAPGRGAARRRPRAHRGRPRLRRPEAVSDAGRRAEVRLRHPLPGQHQGDRRRRRGTAGGRVGRSGRTRARAAGRHGHRRRLSGRHRGVRAGQGHEAAVTRSARASSGGSLRDGAWPPASPTRPPGRWSTYTASARASRARSATPRTCASAWEWARCTSAPPTGATACG